MPIVSCIIFYEARMGPFLESSMFQMGYGSSNCTKFFLEFHNRFNLITNHFRSDLLAQFFLLINCV
jgi:hypothetical protein